jgi:hypothetical protein
MPAEDYRVALVQASLFGPISSWYLNQLPATWEPSFIIEKNCHAVGRELVLSPGKLKITGDVFSNRFYQLFTITVVDSFA